MDGYAVKIDELGKLIGELDTAAGRMADANKKLGGGGAFGSLGTAELGKAGVEFEEAWGFGIGRLGEAASGVAERLKAAKEKYERIEAQFSGELDPTGGVKGDHPRIGQPAGGPVGGGYTGGVRGIDDLASPGADLGDGQAGGGVPGIDRPAGREGPAGADPGDGPVGGGATGGITDILNGLDR
ncbi:hypothetical protein SAMN04489727_9497 [Amycolatopsis tolypomycina]|uniref:Excreted virulence factor EspC, type VII ESX diderm n=1 Tax=Amycolatopsis tolypomycina TaxID=208445 RepID=A0A1H5DP28_9PSEU|nr:hypothetical protein [Amycolatopsis tolypomycina]SED80621.1 hypothetical protein SAMN04489727_9497 [Amycolatopsis tolypomycina]